MKKVTIVFAMLFASLSLLAQNEEKESFTDFYKERTKEFKDWRAKANAEFTDYLKKAWEEFLVNKGRKDPVGTLPDRPAIFGEETPAEIHHGIPSSGFDMGSLSAVPEVPAISARLTGEESVDVDFFGITVSVPFSQGMKISRINAKEQDVSRGWDLLSNSDYMPTVEAFMALKQQYNLSDWALYTAVKKFTDALYIEEYVNEKILLQMFVLAQMKYKVRVGAAGNELILLLPFSSQVYQVSYITDDNVDYYIYGYSRINSQDPLYSFGDDFSIAENKLDLVIDRQITVGYDHYRLKSLPLWSSIIGEEISVPINLPCVQFVLDYPQSDLLMYHKSAIDQELKKAVFKPVRYKILKDEMTPEQAVAFVLNLIQHGFDYKTDIEMFGRAKPLFAEESFFYGSNNCKDRVLLFSWIVQDLLGFETVMFCYPGHVACGVALPESVEGDRYSYGGKSYVMCDPTYIGAPVGATMPQFRSVSPSVVVL